MAGNFLVQASIVLFSFLPTCMLIISLGAVSTISGFPALGLCSVTKVDQLLRIVNYICWAIIGQYQIQSKG